MNSPSEKYDVAILGGGIMGAGCARDAALRGLKVILFEKNDFASATSSASTKLIHGGIRYLEFFDFPLVKESLKEREILLRVASDYVKPLSFVYPVFKNSKTGMFKIRTGLFIYDFLGRKIFKKNIGLQKHSLLDKNDLDWLGRDDVIGGVKYSDAKMFDSALVLANIRDVRKNGAECYSYHEVRKIKRTSDGFQIEVRDAKINGIKSFSAKYILNCTGHWADNFREKSVLEKSLRLSQGAHLFTRRKIVKDAIVLPLTEKARYFFLIPRFGGTLIGTTDTELSNKERENIFPREEEINLLLENMNRNLPYINLKREEISFTFAGVRTLVEENSGRPTPLISRRHLLEENNGFYSLLGGKFTIYRKMAEEAIDRIAKHLHHQKKSLTQEIPLPSAHKSLWELENPDFKHGDICPHHPINFSDLDFYKVGCEGGETDKLSLTDLLVRRLMMPFTECQGRDCCERIANYIEAEKKDVKDYLTWLNGHSLSGMK